METKELNGTAKTEDGDPVLWNLTVLKTAKRPVLINVYAEKDRLEKSAADVKKFLQSITPLELFKFKNSKAEPRKFLAFFDQKR